MIFQLVSIVGAKVAAVHKQVMLKTNRGGKNIFKQICKPMTMIRRKASFLIDYQSFLLFRVQFNITIALFLQSVALKGQLSALLTGWFASGFVFYWYCQESFRRLSPCRPRLSLLLIKFLLRNYWSIIIKQFYTISVSFFSENCDRFLQFY